MESLYYFKENRKGRKRSDRHIHYKILTKRLKKCSLQSAGNSEVSQVKRYLFLKIHFLVRDDKHVIVWVYARFWKISGRVWSRHGYLAPPAVSLKYKPWLDLGRPDIFPNQAKSCTITYNISLFSILDILLLSSMLFPCIFYSLRCKTKHDKVIDGSSLTQSTFSELCFPLKERERLRKQLLYLDLIKVDYLSFHFIWFN